MLLQSEKWAGTWPEGKSAPPCVRRIDARTLEPVERAKRRQKAQKRPDAPYQAIVRGDLDSGSVREGR